ncbi:MAG: hypothetical protein IKI18_04475 [Prevotella sp.]|nr:hypothetical protein [Prevotella sp.]
MKNFNDYHAEICHVAFLPASQVALKTKIGQQDVDVELRGLLVSERPQSANFSERRDASGQFVEQELEAVFTNDEADFVSRFRSLADDDCIVFLEYTNGKRLVVGTEQAPVRLEYEQSGSPKTLRLSFKRKSPEFAKILKSLT